ncbi:ABC transporter permease [Thermobifida halotolerans]|uniref:ABC transporter permease n=1 Tax=Thermobifida halotolerans TaxID=483545 RepID=A0AA97M5J3_9ACTN|nr:ABC transporter permease [Thermobifida halotolerans]UOE21206.1 ABC transporter permease [Thermobifida halotolerans]
MTTATETARPAPTPASGDNGPRKPAKRPEFWQTRAFVNTARVLICVVFLVLWETASRREWVDPTLFGQPTGVWTAMVEYLPSERSLASLEATGAAVGVSFVIGSVSGTLAGLLLGLSPTLNSIFGPFLAPINSVPRIALAPLFIAWFGLTMTSKVVLAVSIVFFILAENARSAVWSVDSDLMTMSRVVGVKGFALLWKVVLPSAVPTMFAGLRLTFTYALLGVVASEMVAATGGLGQDIVLYSSSYQINTVFAILVELMVIAMIVNWLFNMAERRLLVWQNT